MGWLADAVSALRVIPDAVWGAGFTLLTVGITERRNNKRAQAQRDHDSTEKSRDRTMAIRREVYLPVAAEYNAALKFLGTMPNHSIDEIGRSKPLEQFASSAAKLSLISSQETAIAVQKLSSQCAAIYMRFAPMAIEISAARGMAEVHTKMRDQCLGDMEKVTQALGAILESGQPDNAKVLGLQSRNDVLSARFRKEGENLDAVGSTIGKLYQAYGLQFLPEMSIILQLGVRVLVLMRQDLGQSGNADDFAAEAQAAADRIFSIAEATLRGVPIQTREGA